jgi:hypothetical protein
MKLRPLQIVDLHFFSIRRERERERDHALLKIIRRKETYKFILIIILGNKVLIEAYYLSNAKAKTF